MHVKSWVLNARSRSRILVLEDQEDAVECLGTIAKPGKEFIEKNKENGKAVIGQFGLEFYSAFMVAVSVVVTNRKVGQPEEKGLKWTWNRGNSYELADESSLPTGTRVVIHLKPGVSAQFCKPTPVKDVVDKYSFFVAAPILLIGERLNSLNPIWTLHPKDVTKEMHEAFLKNAPCQAAKSSAVPEACYTIHYKTDNIIMNVILILVLFPAAFASYVPNDEDRPLNMKVRCETTASEPTRDPVDYLTSALAPAVYLILFLILKRFGFAEAAQPQQPPQQAQQSNEPSSEPLLTTRGLAYVDLRGVCICTT